jgi:5-formyltetrahydrofolate cyclo-ligase
MTSKNELRRKFNAKRAAIDTKKRELAASAACHNCMELILRLAEKHLMFPAREVVVAAYNKIRTELDSSLLLTEISDTDNMLLAMPVVMHKDGCLTFRCWAPGEPVSADLCGVPAPLPISPEAEPQIIVAPLLAFDPSGSRLGYGGGYYDRTIAELRQQNGRMFFIGLAFDEQWVDKLPGEPHDQRLDAVVTPSAIHEF